MKKIFAIMFSIVMMTVCGNEVKAQTNDAQQNYEVSGSLTSSNHKKSDNIYNVEVFRLLNGYSEYVTLNKVKGNDTFKISIREEGAYKVRVTDNNGNVVMGRVFSIDQNHPTVNVGLYDVANGKRVPEWVLQANKDN